MVQRVALPAPEHIQELGRCQAILLVLKKAEDDVQHWLGERLVRQLLSGPLQHRTGTQGDSGVTQRLHQRNMPQAQRTGQTLKSLIVKLPVVWWKNIRATVSSFMCLLNEAKRWKSSRDTCTCPGLLSGAALSYGKSILQDYDQLFNTSVNLLQR